LAETPRQRLFRGEAKGDHRATRNGVTVLEWEYSQWRIGSIGIDQACPAASLSHFGQREFHDFVSPFGETRRRNQLASAFNGRWIASRKFPWAAKYSNRSASLNQPQLASG
jgi:hypothetical protein